VTDWAGPGTYWISDDPTLLNFELVHEWLSTLSYWARDRPRAVMEKAIARSLNLGAYDDTGGQVGYCRWVTDGATFAWLCDVFVDPAHRGVGLGVFLVETAVAHPEVRDLRLMLGTKDAHELYRKFGFTKPVPERLLERRPPGRTTPSA
jgi:GNAT superfamily N-acetyltransferase